MAEFSYNNTISSSTGITPFVAMYGDYSRYNEPVYQIRRRDGPRPHTSAELKEFAENLGSLNEYLRREMTLAQATYS